MESEILRLAGAPPTRRLVEELARRQRPEDLLAGAGDALDRGEVRAGLNLTLGAVIGGGAPPAELTTRLLPTIEDMQIAIRLLGSVKEGLLEALLETAASGKYHPDRQALVLFLAAVLAGGEDPPDELRRRLRYLARMELDPQAGMLTGLAALEVGDPDVIEVARAWVRMADNPVGQKMRKDLLRRFRSPLIEALPVEAPVEKFAGFTVRREAPRIGRNDPCPCGSGRKYKKCCLTRESRRDVAPDPSAPMGDRARLHLSMTDAQFESLHPQELLRIDPKALPTPRLVHAIDTLANFRRFPEAESGLAELVTRDDLPEGTTPDTVRSGMLVHAVTARDRDAMERILESVENAEDVQVAADLGLAILGGFPDALDRIENLAEESLRELEGDSLVKLCAALLFFTPALGILVARGAIDPRRHPDPERLLGAIEQARDDLLLPPDDPAWEIYDILSDRVVEEQLQTSAVEKSEQLVAEAQQLRRAAAVAREHEAAVRRELKRRETELTKAQRALEESREETELARRASGPSPEVVARLRGKVDEFRTRIADGNEERRVLRRRLSHVRSRIGEVVSQSAEPEPDDMADGLEEDEELGPERLHPRFPIIAREFRDGASAAPDHVARDALVTAGALAGADPGAWSSVKRIKAREDLRSARIGRHRLLFHLVGEDEIEFLRLIPRRDLEGTLRRMG